MKFLFSKSLSLFVLSFLLLTAKAQETSLEIKKKENPHIESFRDKLILRMALQQGFDALEVETQDEKLEFKSNENLRLRFTVQHDFLAITVGFAPDYLPFNNDDLEKGESSTFNFGLNVFANRFFGRIQLDNVTGFYQSNHNAENPNIIESYTIFKDLKKTHLHAELAYSFNPKFSNRSYIMFNERQKKTMGSWLLRAYFIRSRYENVVDEDYKLRLRNQFSLLGSYVHNHVFNEKFNLLVGLGFGAGVSKVENRFDDHSLSERLRYPVFQSNFIAQFGYHSEYFFSGIALTALSNADIDPKKDYAFNDVQLESNIYFGYRLKAPKFISNTFKKFGSLLKSKS
ncbi:MAG: DUF4421 domain-containing protein [Flavobacteriales bacterium]|jgi:hypothetical protein|nr:DUF4421 domain-containing protein [Flavobacteriales bacterium]